MVKMIRHKGRVLVALLTLCGTLAAAAGDEAVRFGSGSLNLLQAGQSFVYSVRIRLKGHDTYLADSELLHPFEDPYGTLYFRVVVTDVVRAGEATRARGRLDEVDNQGKVMQEELYSLVAASKGDLTSLTAKVRMAGEVRARASLGDRAWGIPWVFAGWPPVAAVGREAPTVSIGLPERWIPYKYTSSYDAKEAKVNVAVSYYRSARADDAAKGHKVEYWVKDQKKLEAGAPMGQEASPLLNVQGDYVGDRNRQYNVLPVTVGPTETQVWEPGSAFPTKITRMEEGGKVSFEATLVKVEQVPVEAPAAERALAG